MKLIPYECPSCGGTLTVPEQTDFVDCPYCTRRVYVDLGTQRRVYERTDRHIDEARVRELELQERLAVLDAEDRRRRDSLRLKIGVGLACGFALSLLVLWIGYLMHAEKVFLSTVGLVAMGSVYGLMALVFGQSRQRGDR